MTAATIAHAPWCADHIDGIDGDGDPGLCRRFFYREADVPEDAVEVILVTNFGEPTLEVITRGNPMPPHQAREVAAAIVAAADVLESAGGHR